MRLDGDDFSAPGAPDMIAGELGEALQRDADGFGSGVQRYAIYAYFEKAPHQPAFRKVLMVAGSGPLDNEDSGLTEAPSAVGLVSQLMRHNEINQKNSMVAMGFLFATQQKQLERLMEANDTKDKRQFDLLLLLEEIMSTKHEREVRMEEVKAGIEMRKKGVEKLETLFPIVMNRLTKTNAFPEKASPAALMAASFFDSLTPQQTEVFRQTLSPEQLQAMIEVVHSTEKARHGEETASKKLEDSMKDKVIAMAKKLGPVPQGASPGGMTVRVQPPAAPAEAPQPPTSKPLTDGEVLDFIKTLTPEQLIALESRMTPEQKSFVMSHFKKEADEEKGMIRKKPAKKTNKTQ
jgi:hypothetical protein